MNLGTTRLRGWPRNRWQDGVTGDGRIVGGERWQEKVHNREEWKKLLRMAWNRRILHVPKEWMKLMNHMVGISLWGVSTFTEMFTSVSLHKHQDSTLIRSWLLSINHSPNTITFQVIQPQYWQHHMTDHKPECKTSCKWNYDIFK